jgi:Peptidase family M1 domain
MSARLDPDAKTVTGIERITYRNPSQDMLKELWLRLYLRAFRDFNTPWMRESRGQMRGDRADPTALGDITISKLALAGGADLLASATLTDTLLRVPLPRPLAPNQSIDLDVNWTSQLPRVFARTGFGGRDDTFFMIGQWYPKMTVYDHGHWDTEPWHANAEFFNDFGSYDVSITTPKAYIVAGGGTPKGAAAEQASFATMRYTADDVTDFAFAASPDFKTRTGKSGDVDVVLYYLPEHEASVAEYMGTSIESLQDYSAWYGAYPHSRLTVVDVPDDASGAGGMEYPTLVTGGTFGQPAGSGFVALVVSHEIGHQWWPMQTATNEGREPWLDEGLTEYSGMRYMVDAGRKVFFGGQPADPETFELARYDGLRLPATLPSWEYDTAARYFPSVYNKTALGLWTLESIVGTERFRHAMADYLARYRFKHPTGADFRASLERSLGGDLRWFFDDYMNGSGVIDYAVDRNDGRTVMVTRAGTVRAPVEIGATLASGARLLKTWDGQTPSASFAFPAGDPVKKVEIDPEHKLKAEVDRVNNTSVVP